MITQRLDKPLSSSVDKCIRKLSRKFHKWPYNFFTESDAHSYLYLSLFRYGKRALKITYGTASDKDYPSQRTVLIHREYPTFFRYLQERPEQVFPLNGRRGVCGHYDLVVLSPFFVSKRNIQQVISKDNKKRMQNSGLKNHLIAAIEFKLLHKHLTKGLENEIRKDFAKLSWSLKKGQAREAYMLIFNRWGEEKSFRETLKKLQAKYKHIKLVYQESYFKNKKHGSFIKPYWN